MKFIKILLFLNIINLNFSFSQTIIDFPDINFKNFLITGTWFNGSEQIPFDVNSDGEISVEEASIPTSIVCNACSIENLSGINYFYNLEDMMFRGNNISSIELVGLPSLSRIDFEDNNISSFIVKGSTSLENLNLSENSIVEFDWNLLSELPLTELDLNRNGIIQIDLNLFQDLIYLNISSNQIEEVSVNHLKDLRYLFCQNNYIKKLDISSLYKLEFFDCSFNQIEFLSSPTEGVLGYAKFNNNRIHSIDFSGLSNIHTLLLQNNYLRNIVLPTPENLRELNLSNNRIQLIEIGNAQNLEEMYCQRNFLSDTKVFFELFQSKKMSSSIFILDLQNNLFGISDCEDFTLLRYFVPFLKFEFQGKPLGNFVPYEFWGDPFTVSDLILAQTPSMYLNCFQ